MQHGADPLAPFPGYWGQQVFGQSRKCLLAGCFTAQSMLLAHMERQRAAGSLRLGSAEAAAYLVVGVARGGDPERHLPLACHGIAALERLLRPAGSSGGLPAADAAWLPGCLFTPAQLLHKLLGFVVEASSPPLSEALLASQLPFDLAADAPSPWGLPLVAMAAMGGTGAAACVQLLLQAGAPLTTRDLYLAVDYLSPGAVSVLLACGLPPVDVSAPADAVFTPFKSGWSCPIHRTLHNFAQVAGALSVAGKGACAAPMHQAPTPPRTPSALPQGAELARFRWTWNDYGDGRGATLKKTDIRAAQILEALWSAGFKPTVYRQARLPAFLHPSKGTPPFFAFDPAVHTPALAELDPLALFDAAHPQHAQLRSLAPWCFEPNGGWQPQPGAIQPLVFLARTGGAWSPATHREWPLAFKQAARAVLLCSAVGQLACLPPAVLLHVLKLAAEPFSSWMQ